MASAPALDKGTPQAKSPPRASGPGSEEHEGALAAGSGGSRLTDEKSPRKRPLSRVLGDPSTMADSAARVESFSPPPKASRSPSLEQEMDDLGIDFEDVGLPGGSPGSSATGKGFPQSAVAVFAEGLLKTAQCNEMSPTEFENFQAKMEDPESELGKPGTQERARGLGLLLVTVARTRRELRCAFTAGSGLNLLSECFLQGTKLLEEDSNNSPIHASLAHDLVLACLLCAKQLPITRGLMRTPRMKDTARASKRLETWLRNNRSARAAEIRRPFHQLIGRWAKLPRHYTEGPERPVREKGVLILKEIFSKPEEEGGSAEESAPTASLAATIAEELESAMYRRHNGLTREYRTAHRMIRSNLALPGNRDLRKRLLRRDLTPEELLEMDSTELAPPELQKEREEAAKESLKSVTWKEQPMMSPFTGFEKGEAPPNATWDNAELPVGSEAAGAISIPTPMLLATPDRDETSAADSMVAPPTIQRNDDAGEEAELENLFNSLRRDSSATG